MSDMTRRRIEEIYARYELEPTLCDIYVEGPFDEAVLSQVIRTSGLVAVVPYDIDTVDVPAELLKRHGLTSGRKQRVIALARELAAIPNDPKFRCLVDRDLDHWMGPLESTPRLKWTKYCAMEVYFYNQELIRDLLIGAARSKITDYGEFFDSLSEILRELYSMRLADCELGLLLDWIAPERHVRAEGAYIEFDLEEYTRRLLLKNGKLSKQAEFEASRANWLELLSGDPRNYIRGHDYVDLLAWAVRGFSGQREFSSPAVIRGMFISHSERFKEIRDLIV